MKKLLAVLLASTALLSACGSGDDSPPAGAAADTTVAVNSNVAGAVVGVAFSFPTAVPDLGTTAATTVSFTSTSTTPSFSIQSGGSTASGNTTFGSCIFVVGVSNFPPGHRLSVGQTITVNPCNIRVNTTGQVADGEARSRPITLVLGTTSSGGQSASVVVTSNGQVLLNGRTVGTVPVNPITGAA